MGPALHQHHGDLQGGEPGVVRPRLRLGAPARGEQQPARARVQRLADRALGPALVRGDVQREPQPGFSAASRAAWTTSVR
ncbi:hypothetical protein M271_07420 [Streptomyces rapamycinicus NRRL 5491]|nr:hypothetical protein M271_07420 [Streptomyces rapamycinicus NRRL 5491]